MASLELLVRGLERVLKKLKFNFCFGRYFSKLKYEEHNAAAQILLILSN